MGRLLLLFFLAGFLFSGCDAINPSEKIPSYVAVDDISVKIENSSQGTASHNIVDGWLYVNHRLIGVFEAPFKVPVLESGLQNISIEPGIKVGGSVSLRAVYTMMNNYTIDTMLTEGEVITIDPVFTYRPVVFSFMENFDGEGVSFQIQDESAPMEIISGEEAFENNSMYFKLDKNNTSFECIGVDYLSLPKDGQDVYVEVNFKCNEAFAFGFFSHETSGDVRKTVYTFYPTWDDKNSDNPSLIWKKVYINIKDYLIDSNGYQFKLFFIGAWGEDLDSDNVEVFVDNIKVIHLY
ncbi:MAG: hypothetical protein LBQ22_04745 [Bacteroidales bacterium]|nr:hypothetical protein [Bacteroidales bacterium]